MKKQLIIAFCLLGIVFLFGCSGNTAEPPAIQTEFFFLESTEDNKNFNLYLQTSKQGKTPIAANIAYFLHLRDSNGFLLGTLQDDGASSLDYQDSKGTRHRVCDSAEPDSLKVTADEGRLYYLREIDPAGQGDLYTYPLTGEPENKQEKVGEYILSYALLPGGIVYVTAEEELYLQKDGQEGVQIASGVAPALTVAYERVFYQTRNNPDNSVDNPSDNPAATSDSLFYYEYNHEAQKIASNVTAFQVTADGEQVFYLNTEAELYRYSLQDNSRELVVDWVASFLIENKGQMVIYKDLDGYVYLQEEGQKGQKVGFGCTTWAAAEGKIVYLALNRELSSFTFGQEKTELATGVKNFVLSPGGNSLAFYTIDEQLFYQEWGRKKIMLAPSVAPYARVYFGNSLLYALDSQVIRLRMPEVPPPTATGAEVERKEVEECIPCKGPAEEQS